ncbi:MAG: hypothetical protein ACTSUE_22855 [Promethearchaeota archaeon]
MSKKRKRSVQLEIERMQKLEEESKTRFKKMELIQWEIEQRAVVKKLGYNNHALLEDLPKMEYSKKCLGNRCRIMKFYLIFMRGKGRPLPKEINDQFLEAEDIVRSEMKVFRRQEVARQKKETFKNKSSSNTKTFARPTNYFKERKKRRRIVQKKVEEELKYMSFL